METEQVFTEKVINDAAALLIAGRTEDAYFLLTSAGVGESAGISKAEVTAALLAEAECLENESAYSAAARLYKTAALFSVQSDLGSRMALRSIQGLFKSLDQANDTETLEQELSWFFPHILNSADALTRLSKVLHKRSRTLRGSSSSITDIHAFDSLHRFQPES